MKGTSRVTYVDDGEGVEVTIPISPARRLTPLTSAMVVIAALLAGCGARSTEDKERTPTEIIDVFGEPGSTRLEVNVAACQRRPRVDVQESRAEVRLVATVDVVENAADCADSVSITLSQVIGERIITDESTGEILVLKSPDS